MYGAILLSQLNAVSLLGDIRRLRHQEFSFMVGFSILNLAMEMDTSVGNDLR